MQLHSGDLFKHYKGGLYQIVTKAVHTETEEVLVVYQALYGEYKVFARPESMFLEMVTDENGKAVPRFEKVGTVLEKEDDKADGMPVSVASESNFAAVNTETPDNPVVPEEEIIEGVNPMLIKFLDSDTIDEKLEILRLMKKSLDDKTITDIAVSIDVVIPEGPLEERIKGLEYCLQTRARYETTRLR